MDNYINCRLVGTLAPGQKEIKECIAFSQKHGIEGHVTKKRLEDLHDMVEAMKAESVLGRQVVVFD